VKKSPKVLPSRFLSNYVHGFIRGKRSPKIWTSFVILKNCPKKIIAQCFGQFLKINN
jgi:hypothetical protein